jgi:hypothetical protein
VLPDMELRVFLLEQLAAVVSAVVVITTDVA